MMTRREALKTAALVTTAICAGIPNRLLAADAAAGSAAAPAGPFTVPPLPYPVDALEPHIDARTMELHHDKHHVAYVTNLNKALAANAELGKKSIAELMRDVNDVPEQIRTAVRNNGGGHYNHSLFWQMMKKNGGGQPAGELAKGIDASFSNFSGFKEKFTDAAMKVFGSGWAWLVRDGGKLAVISTPNQDAPIMSGKVPLLGLDVWEHAYYLKYQNRRPEYIAAWFNVINWDFVADRFAKSKG